jgi:hypothetical protein
LIASGDLEVLIPHARPQLDVSVRIQLLLPLSRLNLELKLVPRWVEFRQPVLKRVAADRGVARETVRVAERAV